MSKSIIGIAGLLLMTTTTCFAYKQHFHLTIYNKDSNSIEVSVYDHAYVHYPSYFDIVVGGRSYRTVNYTVKRNCFKPLCYQGLTIQSGLGGNYVQLQTYYDTRVHGWFEYYHREHTVLKGSGGNLHESHQDSGENWSITISAPASDGTVQ